jgi:2-oxoisovalerate dehydrogenase E1 component
MSDSRTSIGGVTEPVEDRLRRALGEWPDPGVAAGDPQAPVRPDSGLTGQLALELFAAQVTSRHLDLAARRLRSADAGYYTIGSAGHEGNAAVAAALRPTDPALLHYRSGAFYCARAGQLAEARVDPVLDVLRGLVASAADPISGGRQKVFGHPELHIIPTTSTAASHLPRAVGLAFALERARHRSVPQVGKVSWPRDAIALCSFGDAAINHASATAAFNTVGWADFTGLRLPVLFVCEDNGLGNSVRSPAGWTGAALKARPGLRYFFADGCDLAETYAVAQSAAAWVRKHRRPAVLHLRVVRLMGETGPEAELAYRSAAEIEHDLALDPVLGTARLLIEAGLAKPGDLLSKYDELGWRVLRAADGIRHEPKLNTAAEVVAPLAPRRPVRVVNAITVAAERLAGALASPRERAHSGRLPERAGGLTLAQTINATLTDLMVSHPQTLLFGQDVARKGGVHGVTKELRDRFGPARVFDTLLDETSVLGLGAGAGLGGLLPVPEIQNLAYLHNAEDQLRGEAASLRFFSNGQYRNPMVVRIAGLAYQQGLGGHFQNDNSVAVLRDIPGLVLAVPSRAEDAAGMLRTCIAAAEVDGTVSVFLEPIALYHTRDLHTPGDGAWLSPYTEPGQWSGEHVPVGRARVYAFGQADELTIVTFGNGVRMSLRVAARLAGQGHGCRVVDLRWLAPLPVADLIREASATERVLIVDETRRTGGVAEGVIATLADSGYVGLVRRVAGVDTFLPLGPAAEKVLVGEADIERAALTLLAA